MSWRTLLRLSVTGLGLILLIAAVRGRSDDNAEPRPGPASLAAKVFEPPVVGDAADPNGARLAEGFSAFAVGELDDAARMLRDPARTASGLEDLRLFILAEATHALEGEATPQASLAALIEDHPESPLRAAAIRRAAEMAAERENWYEALHWAEFAREQTLPREEASAIERLVWEMGLRLEDRDLQKQSARLLAVQDPELAEELEADKFFADASGRIDWATHLDQGELQLRAENLIEAGESNEALEILALVVAEQRGFDWSLLQARALTRDHRGREALELLTDLDSSNPDQQVEILWERALAARDASRVRRSRSNLPESRRQEMGRRAVAHFAEVAQVSDDPLLQRRALKLQFALVSDRDDSFDESMKLMQRLRDLEPTDTTGAGYLWRHGWQAFAKRNYPGAIGYWSELESLYPGTNPARSGRYWTGRSHEALGNGSRAQSIYQEILSAGVEDFYSQQARQRLTSQATAPRTSPASPTEPWPEDPVLDRARWLSDLGLHQLALYEIEAFREIAEPRALCAQEAVVLARHGERRESIRRLACAFPSLGRPQQVTVPLDALELYYPLDYRSIIERRAAEQELPAYLVFAMIRQESAFDASARSWAGARGLMQLMPATGREVAQRLGLRFSTANLNDPDFSVRLGTRYFRQVLDMFDGNLSLALAGYNGGPYRIKKLWRQAGSNPELDRFVDGLSLEETKTYVKRIILFTDSYEKLYSAGT